MIEFTPEEVEERANEKFDSGTMTKALVAFVDLLGFKASLEEEWDQDAKSFITRILKIKSFIEIAKEKAIVHTFNHYDKETIIDKTQYPDFITVSDAFIFFKPIDESSPQKIIISLLSIVASIYELWRAAILHGFTIRGAIEFGDVFYSENEVIGPSYMEAYRGESKEAKTSRIICFKNLTEIIDANISLVDPVLQDYCKLWFKKDNDGWVIINPLTAFGIDNEERVGEALELIKEMELGVESDKVKAKYQDLIMYLADRRAIYSDLEIFKS